MIAEGVLKGVDAALGVHVWLSLPSGEVAVVPGPFMAGSADFDLTIRGRGGHGAMPHETIDATLVAAHVVTALQSIVARNVSPLDTAVVSVGALHAGTAHNIIAERAHLRGTVRAFERQTMQMLRERVAQVVAGVCAGFGAEYDLAFGEDAYPPTVNNARMAEVVRHVAEEVVGKDRVRTGPDMRTMAAEDFGEFLLRVPGCYFFVGARNESTGAVHPHHSPHFDLCEDALPVAVDVLERATALDKVTR
jgi:amidohydrolase